MYIFIDKKTFPSIILSKTLDCHPSKKVSTKGLLNLAVFFYRHKSHFEKELKNKSILYSKYR